MERSFSTSCEWATCELPRSFPTTASFAPRQNVTNEDAFGSGRDQFCMNTVSAFAVSSSPQPTPTSSEGIYGDFRSSYERSTEDLGLLNIPSIQETLGSSFDLRDHDTGGHDESASDWESAVDGSGDGLTSRGETDATGTCGNDHAKDASEVVPKGPIKRLRRQRANDRERRRMKSLNGALNNLKRCIPLPKTKRRVTKLEILRIACHYIQTLWETLHDENNEGEARETAARSRNSKRNHAVNGMTVTQRLSLLSSNLKFNFQL